ncbi:unnamed protein product [Clonostachys rosea]|uniref:F-box domain-containing protein n=1 Tax=Bionectria ochroleuca TaxID=29856 RepID=A0ABY6URL4_BIOOC|nr:unnamed protein product [Clonostachys rosea]
MESVCTLCGVGISFGFSERWLREFRAIYVQHKNWSSVKLSGVGIADETEPDPVCPEHGNQRYDDPDLDPDSTIFLDLNRANLTLKGSGVNTLEFRGFGFHSACWDVLNCLFKPNICDLFHLCLSMPVGSVDGIPGVLDWSHDYGGAAFYSKEDVIPRITAYYTSQLDQLPKANVFKADPYDIPSLRLALESADRFQNNNLNHKFIETDGDAFNCLPPEILHNILTSLSTLDAMRLRMASPAFAQVDLQEPFWRSRFHDGNEFNHIYEPSQEKPASWKTLYFSLRRFAPGIPAIANRKRIWGLALKLQSLLDQMKGQTCSGELAPTLFEAGDQPDTTEWHTASRCLHKAEKSSFPYGSRALRARAIHTSTPLQIIQLSVSFIDFNGIRLISGLTFFPGGGKQFRLGYVHPNQERHIVFSSPILVRGWKVALDVNGIRAIAIITGDDDPSTLVQIIAWTYDMDILTGLEFKHLDTSKDVLLGHHGPFDNMPMMRSYAPSDDRRFTMAIDGPGGEAVTEIHIKYSIGRIYGLKIHTNLGREEIMYSVPDDSSGKNQLEWIAVKPSGSRAIGIFATCPWLTVFPQGHHLHELGLISVNPLDKESNIGGL